MPNTHPLAFAIGTMIALSFISIFVVAFTLGFNPPMLGIQIVWAVLLSAAAGAAAWRTAVRRTGKYDVVVDDTLGTLQLPASSEDVTEGRAHDDLAVPIDAGRITRLHVRRHRKKGRDTDSFEFHTVVEWEDARGVDRATHFGTFGGRDDADAFVEWMKERLGLAGAG
jgi:hypothetical protein